MPSYQKMYLHDAASGVGGTLPGAGSQSTQDSTPTVTASGADTNRSMDSAVGAAQVAASSGAFAFGAVASNVWFRRHVSEPLDAQSIAAGNWVVSGAGLETSANANQFMPSSCCYLWRPSTGARIGYFWDTVLTGQTEPGTAQTAVNQTRAGAALTAQAGDVIVLEVWCSGTPSMAATYTIQWFYDGATEASATDCASFLNAPAAISFVAPPALPIPDVVMAPPGAP